jgi:hypothetical protein
MADKKISELPASTALDLDDFLAVVEDGTTVQATIEDLLDLAPSGLPEGYSIPEFIQGSGSDQTATMTAAIAALPATEGVVMVPAGTFYSQILIGNHAGLTIRGAGKLATTIVGPTSDPVVSQFSTPRGNCTFEDMTFDLTTSSGTMVIYPEDVNTTFRRCRFININNRGVSTVGAINPVFEDCEFDDAGTATGMAVDVTTATRGLRWIRSTARFMESGLIFDATPHDQIDVDGGVFDGGWYLLPTRSGGYTNSGGTVTYTATVLTDSAASFGTVTGANVRALTVLESGSTGTSYFGDYVSDATALFVSAGVHPGYIIRTATKWAVVAAVASETKLYVEEWFDSTTYRPTDQPAAATAYTVYKVIIGYIRTANTATTITVDRWNDFHDGTVATPAAGTLYEVLIDHGQYSGIHASAASAGATGGIQRIRVHGGCRITRGWNDQLSIYGVDARLVVEPSVIIDHGQDYGITCHGEQCRISGTVVHNGAVGIFTSGADCQINAFASGSPWVNPVDGYMGDILISGSRTRCTGSVVVASGAWARYGIVVAGPAVDTGDVEDVDLTGTSATGYSVAGYRLYSLTTPTVTVTGTVLRDVDGAISEDGASGTIYGDASTTESGNVELATSAETLTGTDTARAVTPAGLANVTGGGHLPPMVSGLYYAAPVLGDGTTFATVLNTLYFLRLPRPGGLSITDIGIETAVAAAATGTARFGAYTEVAGLPSVLISEFGTTATDVGATTFIHKAGTVAAGTSPIWLAVVFQTTVTNLQVRGTTSSSGWGGSAGLNTARNQAGYVQASVSGALPNPAVISSKTNNQMPIIVALAT